MIGQGLRRGLQYAFPCLTAFIALAVGGTGANKESPAPEQPAAIIRNLSLAETIPFSTPAPSVFLTETKCDVQGNIYIVQSVAPPALLGSGGLSDVPVLKLAIGSKSTVEYRVPTLDEYRGVIRSDFDVSGDGKLYSLLQALDASSSGETNTRPSSFFAKYRDDGKLDSYVKLSDAPKARLQPFRLAVFRNGNVLVTGTAVNKGEPLQPFIAVFDHAGQFLTYVKPSDNPAPMSSDARKSTSAREAKKRLETEKSASELAIGLSSSSFIVSAPDGDVYLLRDATHPRLYVVSSIGEVVQEFDVPVPAPGLTPSNMAIAGNNSIFISFSRVQGISAPQSSDGPTELITVVNTLTGEVSAVYRLPAEADGFSAPACATSSDNFLFLGMSADRQHQQVVRYTLR